MSELLDAFDDAGLTDGETRAFLVEAIANSEADDWRDIVEPFLPDPEEALRVLREVPGVLDRTQRALAKEERQKEEEAPPLAVFFLQALPLGVLTLSGLHSAASCARVCRAAHRSASEPELWRQRVAGACGVWRLPQPAQPDASWRERYFSLLRPRCDGVYVAEAKFKRWIRLGQRADLRQNAEDLAAKGARGGSGDWVHYRRYVRLLPPSFDGQLWAMVLQDSAPRAAAERALLSGLDVRTHTNPARSENVLSEGAPPSVTDPARLLKRICVGHYSFDPAAAKVHISYEANDGVFSVTFSLASTARRFADQLTWQDYEMAKSDGEVIPFDLGRLPDWKGGGLKDDDKDHFPEMNFRPQVALEHLL